MIPGIALVALATWIARLGMWMGGFGHVGFTRRADGGVDTTLLTDFTIDDYRRALELRGHRLTLRKTYVKRRRAARRRPVHPA